jgi:hypothetical protein
MYPMNRNVAGAPDVRPIADWHMSFVSRGQMPVRN